MSTDIKEAVRERYAEAAKSKGCCCGGSDCGDSDPITRDLYDAVQRQDVPDAGTPRRWLSWLKARRCWTSARAAGST